jgi:hypothetical protein
MTQRKIYIIWQDGRTIDIWLENNPVADYYYNCIKYLQHVDLEFNARKNPLQAKQTSYESVMTKLMAEVAKVGLEIDITQLSNQEYLNELHAVYFSNAKKLKFDIQWLTIHDCIHLLEDFIGTGLVRNSIWFDYEEKAGLLIKPFDRRYLKYATPDITAGMCFLREHELGKSPMLYWKHKEPLNIKAVCEQSKPWLFLKPILSIAFQNNNNYTTFDQTEFNKWFAPVRDGWCQHWNVPDWQPQEMFAGIPIGYVDQLPTLVDCFTKLDYPQRLAL